MNYRLHAVRPYSCTFTNPGAFFVPDAMAPHITGAEVILGQAMVPRCHCASISYGDTMEMHLCRHPGGDGDRAGLLPFSGAGGGPRAGGEQPLSPRETL